METAIAERLKVSSISDYEKSVIFNSLKQAQSGFPDRLQRSVLHFMQDEDIFNNCSGQLLWLLASICREDKGIDLPHILDGIIMQDKAIPTAFSILALLHLEVEKNCSFPTRTMAHSVPVVFKKYCDAVQQPVQKCGLMLMLCQHWFWDYDYLQHSRHEMNYSEYFENELSKALDRYFVFIRMKDKVERELCENYLQTRHYLLLLYRLALKEKERNQNPNIYLWMWESACFFRTSCDVYEAFAVGLLSELGGGKEYAKCLFETLLEENPINKDAIDTLEDFYKRNPEMRR